MINNRRSGFTLIEILIVVAIIAILASVVLVGLGPTQEAGRDARRISDLSEVQNGLELYYNKNGQYPAPGAGTWTDGLAATLNGAGVGISSIPNDPSSNRTYQYWYQTSGQTSYVLGAQLENLQNSVFTNYNSPSISGMTQTVTGGATIIPADCAGSSDGNYCVTL